MRALTMVMTAALLGALGVGCTKSQTRSPSEPRAAMGTRGAVSAGTEVYATLTDAIGSESSNPGDAFVAHVDGQLTTVDGRVLVSSGAVLRGHVVRVTRGPTPRVDVAFDTIETRDGPTRVRAILVDAGGYGQVLTLRMGDPADGGITPPKANAIGGGPRPEGEDEREPRVMLPEGAKLRLMLLDPLVPLDRR